jgi:hypothetical protein
MNTEILSKLILDLISFKGLIMPSDTGIAKVNMKYS